MFLKKQDQLFAYVHVKELLLKSEQLTPETLLSNAISLDTVCQLSKNISLPALFQIIGAPIAMVKNEDGELNGYIRRRCVCRAI